MPTLAIVGAGPGLGLSVARVFGKHGHEVALIARNRGRLEALVAQLEADGVTAAAFTADVTDRHTVSRALGEVIERFGRIDVLEYSPYSAEASFADVLTLDVEEQLVPQVEGILLSGVTAAATVLPAMLEAGTGTLLFTGGIGSIHPLPILAGANAAQAGLRNYVHNLYGVLADRGVYAAWVAVGAWIGSSPPAGYPSIEPDALAATMWEMHTTRTDVERVVTGS
ncbi:MAG: SDR family NAD(P)-dependent oxidoreductase [Nocardioides sp.]|uniref:SDR family NAD(P)-dependent oxidoreductase n=1 Tax=Nocardioides sp. TaxID=35761 RepID=UPI0039E2EAFA